MEIWTAIYSLFAVIVVQAQQPVVDRTEFMDGVPFTVTCDVNRFTSTDIPTSVATITELSIERTVGTSPKTIIAFYIPYPLPGISNLTINITNGRNWTVDATGGVASGSPPNNRASIKLTLIIRDSKCESDTAIYKCYATYLQSGSTSKVDRSLNVTGKASPQDHLITLINAQHNGNDPQVSTNEIGQNVSLSCRVRAPYGSQLIWSGNLPGANIQTTTPSPPTTPLPCARYNYESILNIEVQLGVTTYFCVVNDARGVEISRMNFTIVGSPRGNFNTGANFCQKDSLGHLWNLFIVWIQMCLCSQFY